jgi:hypothetical protein
MLKLHPQGYLCCKRRVLEFDEFLKIEGCKKGRHVFVPKQRTESQVCTLTVMLLLERPDLNALFI